jgi:hypothetical protein
MAEQQRRMHAFGIQVARHLAGASSPDERGQLDALNKLLSHYALCYPAQAPIGSAAPASPPAPRMGPVEVKPPAAPATLTERVVVDYEEAQKTTENPEDAATLALEVAVHRLDRTLAFNLNRLHDDLELIAVNLPETLKRG